MTKDNYVTIVDQQGKQRRVLAPKDGNVFNMLQDGERLRVSMMDAMAARDGQLSDADRYVLADQEYRAHTQYNRPGFRVLHDQEAKDGRTVVDAAYADYEPDLVSSYRHVRDDNVRDDIWSENVATMSNPPAGAGVRRASAPEVPEDKDTGAGSQARLFGQQPREGSQCTINGAPGHWRNGVCVADDPDDDHAPSPEEALSDRAMRDAEANRERSYQEYSRYVENAWRMK